MSLMQVIKPKRSADADKTWGIQQDPNFYFNDRPLTYIDHLGRLVWIDPRMYYNSPAPEALPQYLTLPSRISNGRVLMESSKANWFYYTEALDNAWWIKTNLSITPSAELGPLLSVDGQKKMSRLVATTTSGLHQIQGSSVNGMAAAQVTVSWVLKRAGTGTGSRYVSLNSAAGSVGFDLQTGTKTTTSGAASGGIMALYSSSFLVWMTYTHAAGSAAPSLGLRSTSGAGTQSFAGNGVDGVFAGFPQIENGELSSYMPAWLLPDGTPSPGWRGNDQANYTFPLLASSEACRLDAISAEWMPDGIYSAGAKVSRRGVDYQSILSSNLGNDPASSPSWWSRIGASNAWAMFDELLSSATVAEGVLDVAFLLQGASSIALMGLVGVDEVRVMLSAGPGQLVYSNRTFVTTGMKQIVIDLLGSGWFMAEVRLTNAAGTTLQVGNVVWGVPKDLGSVRYGARSGIRDYSRKETNEFGEAVFVKRAYAKTMSCVLEVEKTALADVQSTLEDLRATPALWIGSPDLEYSQTLVVYGFYKDFYVSVDYPTMALCSLELEGLI